MLTLESPRPACVYIGGENTVDQLMLMGCSVYAPEMGGWPLEDPLKRGKKLHVFAKEC